MTAFPGLRYPARGYFILWCLAQAAVVGLLLGDIVVEPRAWWRNLLCVGTGLLMTWFLYHIYRFTDRGFRWLEQRLGIAEND